MKKDEFLAKEIADKFCIPVGVCSDIKPGTGSDIKDAVIVFVENMLTKICQDALGSDRYTVKVEIKEHEKT